MLPRIIISSAKSMKMKALSSNLKKLDHNKLGQLVKMLQIVSNKEEKEALQAISTFKEIPTRMSNERCKAFLINLLKWNDQKSFIRGHGKSV